MKLHLVDPNAELCAAWEEAFFVFAPQITQGYFQDVEEYECIINAGNSFGLMDGGVDGHIAKRFPTVAGRVQDHIVVKYAGEQPVGSSFITFTGDSDHPYIAHTPTMRVPEDISQTDNVYNAMRGAIFAIRDHNANPKNHHSLGSSLPRDGSRYRIDTALCMGLGTATGKVPLKKAAWQMAMAYASLYAPITEITWRAAQARSDAVHRYDHV